MESIQNALVQRYAKQKMQEMLGGGGASNTQDAQSMVINMVKEKFGLGHSDAEKVTHQMTGPAQQELGMGGGGGLMSQAASFLGGGGNQRSQEGSGGQQGGDMSEAHNMAGQALGGGQFPNEVMNMLMSKFGMAPEQAQGVVNTQQQRLGGGAAGGGGFASKAEGFLEKFTGQ